jgi:hypothetical protein
MAQLGRALLIMAAVIGLVGGLMRVAPRLGLPKLPGDFVWRGRNTTVYFPLATSIIISIVLTLLLNLVRRR